MIRANSRVVIKSFFAEDENDIGNFIEKLRAGESLIINDLPLYHKEPTVMVVEGLYYQAVSGMLNIKATAEKVVPTSAKCVWYNSQNELQTETIDLDILTEI